MGMCGWSWQRKSRKKISELLIFFPLTLNMTETQANIGSLILDAGPLILQSYTALQKLAGKFYTTPSVHDEIKDEQARQNLALWGDQLIIRQPKPESIKFVSDFAKMTGDYAVLSITDLGILALCYEIDIQEKGSDEHLRKEPVRATSGSSTAKKAAPQNSLKSQSEVAPETKKVNEDDGWSTVVSNKKKSKSNNKGKGKKEADLLVGDLKKVSLNTENEIRAQESEKEETSSDVKEEASTPFYTQEELANMTPEELADLDFENDDGWITSDNVQDVLEKDGGENVEKSGAFMQTAVSTGDFAMQNVALQIGLNLINPASGLHIKKVRNYMMRCHACFKLCQFPKSGKPLQFCPRCGGATLMKTTVSVASNGKITVHLKKNIQWWHRGDRYSLPSPQSRKARQKGQDRQHTSDEVLLRADQKEYAKAVKDDQWKRKNHEKMLEDWVGGGSADGVMSPFAISGYKRDSGYKHGVKIGRGRYVNSGGRKK